MQHVAAAGQEQQHKQLQTPAPTPPGGRCNMHHPRAVSGGSLRTLRAAKYSFHFPSMNDVNGYSWCPCPLVLGCCRSPLKSSRSKGDKEEDPGGTLFPPRASGLHSPVTVQCSPRSTPKLRRQLEKRKTFPHSLFSTTLTALEQATISFGISLIQAHNY